ncbi:MAG TPA: galactose-1-phosphate uridylyltransferase [Anaerolineae bacterium]|nr:galactose-1-phosphate uridylyltransferase [Anaerolineae bacterium]
MPELRKDPVIGRWVIISTERAKRPSDFKVAPEARRPGPCPFCGGHEGETPPEIFALRENGDEPNSPGWQVRVVPNKYPALRIEGGLNREGVGMCDMMNGVGAHEVIVETPDHDKTMADLDEFQISKILWVYTQRIADLGKDDRFKYVLVFKNQGEAAGASLQHAHSQLIATPVTPKRVKEELVGAQAYYNYKQRCIFCDYIKQETRFFTERLVMETDGFVALSPFAARFPFETWILPKRHMCDFTYIKDQEFGALAHVLRTILNKMRVALNDPAFNYILHTAPFRRPRPGYWATVEYDYHWHIEIIPRLTKMAGFEWGSGFYINPTSPEVAAQVLRNIEVPSAASASQKPFNRAHKP